MMGSLQMVTKKTLYLFLNICLSTDLAIITAKVRKDEKYE